MAKDLNFIRTGINLKGSGKMINRMGLAHYGAQIMLNILEHLKEVISKGQDR